MKVLPRSVKTYLKTGNRNCRQPAKIIVAQHTGQQMFVEASATDADTLELYDTRYGFLGPTNKGLWRLRVHIDPQNCRQIGPVERINAPLLKKPPRTKRARVMNFVSKIKQIYRWAFEGVRM